jgi:hypothetical protein
VPERSHQGEDHSGEDYPQGGLPLSCSRRVRYLERRPHPARTRRDRHTPGPCPPYQRSSIPRLAPPRRAWRAGRVPGDYGRCDGAGDAYPTGAVVDEHWFSFNRLRAVASGFKPWSAAMESWSGEVDS